MSLQTKLEQSVLSSNHTLQIQVGDICCAVICHDEETLGRLKQLYGVFVSGQHPDITMELKVTNKMSMADFEASLPTTEYFHEGNLFGVKNLTATGERYLDEGVITMEVEKHYLNSDEGRGFVNYVSALLYYTACKVKHNGNPPAYIVHSCGILRHGQVLLFSGPSGVGKSTIGRMCGDEHGRVLNDEAVLVSRPHQDNDALIVRSIPIIGELPQNLNVTAPLGGVFLLKQGQQTSVRRLDRTEAYMRFMRQIACPAYFGQRDRRTIFSLISQFSDEVTRTTPFYELEFTLDREALWAAVAELEASLDKGRRHDDKPDNQGC